VAKTGAIVSAEEHQRYGGLGERISQMLVTNTPAPQEYVAVNDSFGESGKPEELLEKYGLSSSNVVAAVHRVLKRK
jgi:transketolase